MRDCLILGSGRSGTSMVTGSLARAGYFMGDDLYPARTANPKGFFEGAEVNGINEALLAPLVPADQGLGENQRWLAALPEDVRVTASPELDARIRRATSRRPFCFKDPRFSYTLPAWAPHLGDAGLVCVFRHPGLTAHSMAKEVRTAAYLQGVPFDQARGLALWIATYRAVVRRLRKQGDWLFLHYDQVLAPEGVARLGEFLGVTPDASFPDKLLQRPPPEGDVPAEAMELYAELCELARHRPTDHVAAAAATPDVSVIAIAGPAEKARLDQLAEALRDQRHARAELVVVDPADVGWSRAAAWKVGAARAKGRYLAGWEPGAWPLPSQMAHAVKALDEAPDARLFLSHWWHSRPPESFVTRVAPGGDALPGGWRAAAVWRRDAIDRLRDDAFWPAELALYRQLRDEGRVVVVSEPLMHVEESALPALDAAARRDAAVLDAQARRHSGAPLVSVILCTYDRKDVLRESLEAFCLQALPLGAYELVVVDDGSTDGTDAALAPLTFAVPVKRVRQENGGLAAARNAGIAVATGAYLHLVNDDTIPEPDCLAEHLAAHRAHPGKKIAVLGTFEQPPAVLGNALMRACETGTLVFCYSLLKAGELHPPSFLYTCNVTVSAADVRAVGGFDVSFRHYGAEDTDLGWRLGALGYRVLYHPKARATHRHTWGYDYLVRRNPMVARAHVRLFRKHPEAMDAFGCHEHTLADLHAQVAARVEVRKPVAAAARGLADVDLGALEALGPAWHPYAGETAKRLAALLGELNSGWWQEGFAAGLREHGLAGFPQLLAEHPLRAPVPGRQLLCFPMRDGAWLEVVRRFCERAPEGTTLTLQADAAEGLAKEVLHDAVIGVRHEIGSAAPVVVLAAKLHPGQRARLLAGADGWVPTGSPRDARLRRLAGLVGTAEVTPAAWTGRSPWPLGTRASRRVLAWPDWSSEDALAALLGGVGRALARAGDSTLVLRFDPTRDGDADAALARLAAAGERALPDVALDVLLVDERMDDAAFARLLRAVDAVVGDLAHARRVTGPADAAFDPVPIVGLVRP